MFPLIVTSIKMDRYIETAGLFLKIQLLLRQDNERIVKFGTVLQMNKHKKYTFGSWKCSWL
jgi:hypothetical protein